MGKRCAGTVYVVDDDCAVRDSLADLFAGAGYQVAGFASGEDFLRRRRLATRCCLVLDIRLTGINGLELQRALAREKRSLPTVVLSAHGDVRKAVEAMKAGAVDFLEKPFDPRTLLSRVARAMEESGEAPRARGIEAGTDRLAALSGRELEVLRFVAQGRTSKEIARALFLSPRTVETHRIHIMDKLDAHSVAELVRVWLEDAGPKQAPAAK